MTENFNCKKLENPSKFFHSHVSYCENIFLTSGMVSRKDELTGINIGVKATEDSSEGKVYVHDIKLQFMDIVNQLQLICNDLDFINSDIRDHILETKVYIVNVKKYFADFNKVYGEWMGNRNSYPARTTIGVADLPSNVILEMGFVLSK